MQTSRGLKFGDGELVGNCEMILPISINACLKLFDMWESKIKTSPLGWYVGLSSTFLTSKFVAFKNLCPKTDHVFMDQKNCSQSASTGSCLNTVDFFCSDLIW